MKNVTMELNWVLLYVISINMQISEKSEMFERELILCFFSPAFRL